MDVGVLEGRPVGPGQFAGAGGVCAGRLGSVAQAPMFRESMPAWKCTVG